MPNNNADFTPSIPDSGVVPTKLPYNPTGSFKFWAQKVIPLVYDDSLSYYEVLCKVVEYLNNVIQNVDNLNDSVDDTNTSFTTLQEYVNSSKDALLNAYNELQDYVNNYFDDLDIQSEINRKLDEMADSGELSGLISPFLPSLVSAWLTEHVTPVGSAVVVDNSLSIPGAAADAQKTGEGLRTLENGYHSQELSFVSGGINTAGGPTTNNKRIRTESAYMPLIKPGDYVYIAPEYKAVVHLYSARGVTAANYYGLAHEGVYKYGFISLDGYQGAYANIVLQKVGHEDDDISADVSTVGSYVKYVSITRDLYEKLDDINTKLENRAQAMQALILKTAFSGVLTDEYIDFLNAYGFNIMDKVTPHKVALNVQTSGEKFVSSANSRSVWFEITPEKTYVVTKFASNGFRLVLSDTAPAVNVVYSQTVVNHEATELEITADGVNRYLFILYGIVGGDYTDEILEQVYNSIGVYEV